jgi:hypothetical protein
MSTATVATENPSESSFPSGGNAGGESDLSTDRRWQLVERISQTEAFQKSSRLPALLRYLASCSLRGDRAGLTEQAIGRAVFGKPKDYTPAEDSAVRVYVRQLRLRLHEYYHSVGQSEPIVVDLPKGAYALSFTTVAVPSTLDSQEPAPQVSQSSGLLAFLRQPAFWLLLGVSLVTSVGWYRSSTSARQAGPPWPLNQVIQDKVQTTVVLADIGYALRLLSNKKFTLDQYIDRSFVKEVVPDTLSEGEVRLIHYLEVSQITSVADAHASATISALAGPYFQNLQFRSAKDLNPRDLSHNNNFIFVGAQTSNPWVELFEDRLNFRVVEDIPNGNRYIANHSPLPGERSTYTTPGTTGSSGEDYAIVALLPNKDGNGSILLIQGLRMEGTDAAVRLLANEKQRVALRRRLMTDNGSITPPYFEALLHAQSVAGAPVSVEFISVRAIKP